MLQKRRPVARLLTIVAHAFNKLSSPAFNIIVSLIIIRIFSDKLWGEFISLSLIANLILQVIAWGHKEYLVKAFSQHPASIAAVWQQATVSRFALYILCLPVFFFLTIPAELKIALAIWIFTLYIYRSFDVLTIYYRNFNFSTLIELSGYGLLIIGIIFLRSDFSIFHLVWLNIAITLFKSIGMLLFYRKSALKIVPINMNTSFFREAFPFFLPATIGFLQSKADIYVVALSLPQNELAEYQIFINLLSMIHQVALLAITPYTKNMYRLNDQAINRLAWTFFSWGSAISVFCMPAVYFIITFYYQITLPWSAYGIGLLLMLPLFFYAIKTYQWFKHNDQYKVVMINFFTAIASLLLSIVLIPYWGMAGALVASCIAQWLTLLLFLRNSNRQKNLYEQL